MEANIYGYLNINKLFYGLKQSSIYLYVNEIKIKTTWMQRILKEQKVQNVQNIIKINFEYKVSLIS